jgi:archaemetzincin
MQIILQPILVQESKDSISILENLLAEEFNASVSTASPIKGMPLQLFDKHREQWKSDKILQWLLINYRPNKSTTKILAICELDAYSNELNFVFGEAYIDGSMSAIYLPRLRQEFYGLKTDNYLFHQRMVKEAVHELGHAFGLSHCNNQMCVMHFSNLLHDTDIKQKSFCDKCRTLLPVNNNIYNADLDH